jgi:hypothetical protein
MLNPNRRKSFVTIANRKLAVLLINCELRIKLADICAALNADEDDMLAELAYFQMAFIADNPEQTAEQDNLPAYINESGIETVMIFNTANNAEASALLDRITVNDKNKVYDHVHDEEYVADAYGHKIHSPFITRLRDEAKANLND